MKLKEFDYLAQLPGGEREQNWIRMRLGTLSVREGIVLAAAAQADPPEDAAQAINQLQSLDEYRVLLDAGSYEALGRRYLLNDTRMPVDALPFTDLEAVGRQYEEKHPGLFIGSCYVQYPDTPSEPVYQPGTALPADDGWSVKVKLASPAVPEGVWFRLPGLDEYKAHLLEKEGYTPTADGWGFIRRNNNEFYYQFSTSAQTQEEPGMEMQ